VARNENTIHKSSATHMDEVVPGMLVSCCACWYRVTHRHEGVWRGVRLGVMDRESAERCDQSEVGCFVWKIPVPFLWSEEKT
jgi:hypothetical protein